MVNRVFLALSRLISKAATSAKPDEQISSSGLVGQVAPLSDDARALLSWYGTTLWNPDAMMGRHAPSDSQYYLRGFGLYEEMLDKDPTVKGLVNQRERTVLAAKAILAPANDEPQAMLIRDFIAQAISEIKGWSHARAELWMAVFYGVSYLEIDWQPVTLTVDGVSYPDRILPRQLYSRRRGRFVYNIDNELQLLSTDSQLSGKPVPPGKILDFAPYKRYENPYGVALARVLWFFANAKKHGFRWLVVHVERYGSPYSVLKYPKDSDDKDRAGYLKMLNTLKTGSGVSIPDDVDLDMENMPTSGSGTLPHETLIKLNDEQMAIATLGQTLTVKQGDKGARSLGEVHMDVRADIIQSDADALSEGIQRLVNMMVELNFGTESLELAPRYTIQTRAKSAEKAKVRFDTGKSMGLPMSKKQAYDDLELNVPKDDGDTIEIPQEPSPIVPNDAEEGSSANTKAALNQANSPPTNTPTGWIARAKVSKAAHDALSLGNEPIMGSAIDFAIKSAGHASRMAALEDNLPDQLQTLYRDSVKASSDILKTIPNITRDWILDRFAAAGIQPDDAFVGDPSTLGWDNFELPEDMTTAFVDRLHDDLTLASLFGHVSVMDYAAANQPTAAMKAAAAGDPGSTNPLITALYGKERIIPRRVLSVANRVVRRGMSWDSFYQLDALGRSASFTAWDLLEAEVRHLGGAFQDAINWGYTAQGYADYIYERLRPRYVTTGEGLHAWHVETIYHTNFARVYNQAQTDEAWELREDFPFLQFVNPDPQFAACVEMAGGVWRTDSATVQNYTPPLHFNCGSSWRMLTDEMLENTGETVNTSPPVATPEVYAGPGGVGIPAPFGAWAPLNERYDHLAEEIARIGAPS